MIHDFVLGLISAGVVYWTMRATFQILEAVDDRRMYREYARRSK